MNFLAIAILVFILAIFIIELLRGKIFAKAKVRSLDSHDNKLKFTVDGLKLTGGISVLALAGMTLFSGSVFTGELVHYSVKEGKQNYKPKERITPVFGSDGFVLTGYIDSSSYYSQKDWAIDSVEYDRDWHDLNKTKGLTRYITANNNTSVMIAWRPDTLPYHFQVAAYTNYPKSKWQLGEPVTIQAGEIFIARCEIVDDKANYLIAGDGDQVVTSHDFRKRIGMAREIGTWVGGANNEYGPYGGSASQDMDMHLAFHPISLNEGATINIEDLESVFGIAAYDATVPPKPTLQVETGSKPVVTPETGREFLRWQIQASWYVEDVIGGGALAEYKIKDRIGMYKTYVEARSNPSKIIIEKTPPIAGAKVDSIYRVTAVRK